MKAFQVVDKAISWVSKVFLWISAASIFLMSLVCFCDVFLRYFFNSPISGGQEMVQCFMAIFVFLGMGMATRRYRLTRVPLFLDKMGTISRNIVQAFGSLICCAASILFCRQLMLSAIRYYSKASALVQTINIPYWPFYAMASVGCGLMALEMLLRLIREIGSACTALKKSEPDLEVSNQ